MFWLALKRVLLNPGLFRAPGLRAPLRNIFNYLRHAFRYHRALANGAPIQFDGSQRLTVVLLSYKRIENIKFIVQACLRLPHVERIVISNNNPEYSIREWVPDGDPRLALVDQPEHTLPGVRFEIARRFGGDFFFCIDDDIFLTPDQLHAAFLRLIENPQVPHGVQGQDVIDEPFSFTVSKRKPARRVDILNRFYAFTAQHLDEYFRLLERFGSPDANRLGFVEDVVLSFTGEARPLVDDLGAYLSCPTSDAEGVAIWVSQNNFEDPRRHVFQTLRQHKPLAR